MDITETLFKVLFNPKALIVIILFLIFMFGGGDFIFRNPAIIVFGILAMLIMAWGGGKK